MDKEKDLEKINYQKKFKAFYNNLNNYLEKFVIPDVIAFYIANGFEHKCLGNHSLENHLNSALNLFNVNIDINNIIPLIKEILIIKYNLRITNENPLTLEKEH